MDSGFACIGDVSDSQKFETYFEPLRQSFGDDGDNEVFQDGNAELETCPPFQYGVTSSPEFAPTHRRAKGHKKTGTPSVGATTNCCSVDICREPGRESLFLRTFICNFIPTQVVTECQAKERERNQAFWNLVELRPELSLLMRRGEFFHETEPNAVQEDGLNREKLPERCRSSERLRARDRAIHEEERARCQRRRDALLKLQLKSGQKVVKSKKGLAASSPTAPAEFKNFSDVVDEMNEFDVRCRNPVRTERNPPTKESFEWGDDSFAEEEEEEDEGNMFDYYWGGEEEDSKKGEVSTDIERAASVSSVTGRNASIQSLTGRMASVQSVRAANPSTTSLGFNSETIEDSHKETLASSKKL